MRPLEEPREENGKNNLRSLQWNNTTLRDLLALLAPLLEFLVQGRTHGAIGRRNNLPTMKNKLQVIETTEGMGRRDIRHDDSCDNPAGYRP